MGKAVDALSRCNTREARQHFAEAYQSQPTQPDAALGFALTDLLLLAESDEITEILSHFGFSERIDVQAMLFDGDGLLARLRRNESCSSIIQHLTEHLNHPALEQNRGLVSSDISPGLRGEQLKAPLSKLAPRLDAIATALEVAATQRQDGTHVEGHRYCRGGGRQS